MARPDPNAQRPGGSPFKYKPRPKLDPLDEALEGQMVQAGMLNLTQPAAAAMLGVGKSTLLDFWEANPRFREAYEQGKRLREVKLRAIGDRHMVGDPATWRFMAKNELGLSDDPSKAKADEATAGAIHQAMTRQEADKRILELKAKLIGQRIVPHEKANVEEIQSGDQEKGRVVRRAVPESELHSSGVSGDRSSSGAESVREPASEVRGVRAAVRRDPAHGPVSEAPSQGREVLQ